MNNQAENIEFVEINYDFIYGNLFKYILKLTNSVEDAEDLIQDFVVKLLSKDIHIRDDFHAFLYTIVINMYKDRCKRKNVVSKYLYNLKANSDDSYDDFNSYFVRKDILSRLDCLGSSQLRMLYLKYFYEYTYREIAAIFKVSCSSVWVCFNRIKMKSEVL